MQTGTPGIREIERLVATVVTDNYYDALRLDRPGVQRFRTNEPRSLHAEHGLSYYLEATVDGVSTAFMFDYGIDGRGVLGNLELLAIDPGRAAAFGLSHGHRDHWGAMADVLLRYRAGIRRGTPLYVGRETFARRFHRRPTDTEPTDMGELRREDLEALDAVVPREVTGPTEVVPGLYLTGRIERVTGYEQQSPTLFVQRGEHLEPDELSGEQAAVCVVGGKGLVVISGCAHRGIVNTVMQAQRMTGVERVHAIVGGFHLINAAPEVVARTVEEIRAIAPDRIIPAHCTGFEAITAFAREMPDQFILNTAGTKYTFG